MARDSDCWDAYASILGIKHVLDGQNMGDLGPKQLPKQLPCIGLYRKIPVDVGRPLDVARRLLGGRWLPSRV